ncbi:hypothetical protein F5X68DRAFT_233382 [Plectosphaerella plurivora]|uniref:Uncharacterized protein n=1 Tax=Plectosphaerella plurivora TaxID=936078 RepID=A0A9P9A9D3_9PEZI|nr:hypothetical protein F5X68DRAFT_233382 [Plectosphaerella plurivora]
MKTSLLLLALAGAVPILAAIDNNPSASGLSAEEECGELGVMVVPPGEDPSKYRRCRDHPSKLWKHNPDSRAKGPWHHSNAVNDKVVIHEMEPSPRLLERPMPGTMPEEIVSEDESKDGPSNIEDL